MGGSRPAVRHLAACTTLLLLLSGLLAVASGENDQVTSNEQCVGDPALSWPQVNQTTGQKGLKDKPCTEIDKEKDVTIRGVCVKSGVCEARSYTGLDGKEHLIVEDGTKKISAEHVLLQDDQVQPGTKLDGKSAPDQPLSHSYDDALFKMDEIDPPWQGEHDSPPVEPELSHEPSILTEGVTTNSDGSITVKTYDEDGSPVSSVTNYPDGRRIETTWDEGGNKVSVAHRPDGTLDRRDTERYTGVGPGGLTRFTDYFNGQGDLAYTAVSRDLTEQYRDNDGLLRSRIVGNQTYFETFDPHTGNVYGHEVITTTNGASMTIGVDSQGFPYANGYDAQGQLQSSVSTIVNAQGEIELWTTPSIGPPFRVSSQSELMTELIKLMKYE